MNWNQYLRYSEGKLYWLKSRGRVKAGDEAGSYRSNGYRQVKLNGKPYKEHRVIWELHNGPIPEGLEIDHINRVRDDNRIENLRLATRSENSLNNGHKGVHFNTQYGDWRAKIMIQGKSHYLGSYDTEEEARAAYVKARAEAGFPVLGA